MVIKLTVVVLVHEREGAVYKVAEGVAQLRVVGENESPLAEGQVAPKDSLATDVPPERVHRIPARRDNANAKVL